MLTLELIIGCQYSVLAHMSVEAIAGRAIFGVPRSMAVLVAAVLEPYCQYWPYWRVLEGMLAVLRCIGANLPYPLLPLCPLIGVAQVTASIYTQIYKYKYQDKYKDYINTNIYCCLSIPQLVAHHTHT